MSNWLSEWSTCDMSRWWEDIFDIRNSTGFQEELRINKVVTKARVGSEVVGEEATREYETSPEVWTHGSYMVWA